MESTLVTTHALCQPPFPYMKAPLSNIVLDLARLRPIFAPMAIVIASTTTTTTSGNRGRMVAY